MQRLLFFLLALTFSIAASAASPDQYALQVLQKDLPRSLRWFQRITHSQQLSQVEVYEMYRSALPEPQENKQSGISVKGSLERMILLLEGARYFEQIQKAPVEFQNRKEIVLRVLQTTKDHMDRFQFGEDPQNLLEEWQTLGANDFDKLTLDLVETYADLQKLLNDPVILAVEQKVDAQSMVEPTADSGVEVVGADVDTSDTTNAPVVASAKPAPTPVNPTEINFEKQRFTSYIQTAEAGKVAGECQGAVLWKTDQAESCQSDDSLECDRSYARQCKKLQ